MKTGILISVLAHGIMLLLIILEPIWKSMPREHEIEVTEVTLMSSAEFDAQLSNTPLVPDLDLSPMAQPETDVNDAERPDETIAPKMTEMDVTENPSERDSDPDLSAVERLAQPDVATETVQPFNVDSLPQISPMISAREALNSPSPVFKTPPTPRAAPRVDNFAAPALPENANVSDRTTEAVTPDETATEKLEETEAEAPPESVTEILPDAQPDVPMVSRPPRRSSNVERTAKAIETARREAEEEEARQLLEQELLEQEAADIAKMLEESTTEPEQPAVNLSGGERLGIIEAVSRNWNKSIVLGKENYEQLVITLSVFVQPNGAIVKESIFPVEPTNPVGDYEIAYNAARRSVLRAEVIPMPVGQFPDGVRLILKFDPAYDTAGLN